MSHPSVGGFPRSKSSGTFLKLFIPTAPSLRGDTVLSFAFRNPLRLLRPVPWTPARAGIYRPTPRRPPPPPAPLDVDHVGLSHVVEELLLAGGHLPRRDLVDLADDPRLPLDEEHQPLGLPPGGEGPLPKRPDPGLG